VSLIAEGRYLDVKKDLKFTLGQLVEKYKENHKGQRSFGNLKTHALKRFVAEFGENTFLSNIRYVDLETYRNKLKATGTIQGRDRQDSSVNREMSCIRHMFKKAKSWEMIEQSPFGMGEPLRLKENNERTRYLSEDEIDRLLKACRIPHVRDIVETTIHTGMRYQEVRDLKWHQIRDGFIYLHKTKTDEARQIPVDDELQELFKNIRKRNQLVSDRVFVNEEGRAVKYITTAYTSALKRANVHGATFHTLRHTFASHFLMRGGHLKTLQKILGHKSIEQTMRYSHLSQEFAREEIQLMCGITGRKCDKKVTDIVSRESILSTVSKS
jgi:integrase